MPPAPCVRSQEVGGLVQNSWYLDDGLLVGTPDALVQAWDIMMSEGAKRGLFLSKEKSLVYHAHLEPANKDPMGRGVPRADLRGFKLLGAPLGTEEFEANILEGRLVSIRHLLDSLHHLDDPHMEYQLLKSCFSFPKVAFSLRTVDTSHHQQFRQSFDWAVRQALEAILGTPLTSSQWTQASLPVAKGWLGLRLADSHGAAAFLSSYGASQLLVQEMRWRQQDFEVTNVDDALAELNNLLGDLPLTRREGHGHDPAEAFSSRGRGVTQPPDRGHSRAKRVGQTQVRLKRRGRRLAHRPPQQNPWPPPEED